MATTHFSGPLSLGSDSVKVITGTTTLTAKDDGKICFLDAAAGATVTLPALSAGARLKFTVTSAFATSNWVIGSAEGDNISGVIADMGTTVAAVLAGAEDQINFVATAETIGDFIELVADTTNSQWIVNGVCGTNGGITATDPS